MTTEATPGNVRLNDGLGPLPPCARVVEYNAAKGYTFDAYTAEQMLAYAAAEVARALDEQKAKVIKRCNGWCGTNWSKRL